MDNNKKNIFITIDRGIIIRNLFQNDYFGELKKKYNIIVFSPLLDDKRFLDELGDNVKFEKLRKHSIGKLERIFISLHKDLIYNPTTKIKSWYGIQTKHKQKKTIGKVSRNYFEEIVFGKFLSKLKFLRDWLKWLDSKIFKSSYYDDLFEKYKPAAVFVTNIHFVNEVYVLKAAKQHGVYTIGMTKSWDNFSKNGYRAKVDKLIVWSDFMKKEAMQFQNYKEGDIVVVGIPQFDLYKQVEGKYVKKDFTDIYGLDPEKKIILFGQGGPTLSPDDPYIVSVIKKWIIKEKKDYQVLIRPHFAHPGAVEAFDGLVDNEHVFIDTICKPSNFKDQWDFSSEHHLRLALSIRFSDVLVTSITTLVLDALVSDNRVICYYFDEDKEKPFGDSIKRLYETLWFLELRENGLDSFMVKDEKELTDRIELLVNDKSINYKKEREAIIKSLCYRADGEAGKRLFSILINCIESNGK